MIIIAYLVTSVHWRASEGSETHSDVTWRYSM